MAPAPPTGGLPASAAPAAANGSARNNPAKGHVGYNGAATMTLDSGLPPRELVAGALQALQAHKVSVVQVSAFVLRCERFAVEFDAEVAAVDAAQARFIVRFQLLRGDHWLFKELCNRVLPAIRLEADSATP